MPENKTEKPNSPSGQNGDEKKTLVALIPDSAHRAGIRELKGWEDDTEITEKEAETALRQFLHGGK